MSDLTIPAAHVMAVSSDDLVLVRDGITAIWGFLPPDSFVADLIAFTDGRSMPGWSEGRSAAFWSTLGARYGFTPSPEYVEALKRFVDELDTYRASLQ